MPIESLGNTKLNASGHTHPRSDGPSRIPAAISPITGGCPNRANSAPTVRVATIMTITLSKSRLKGPFAFSFNADKRLEAPLDEADAACVIVAATPTDG